MNHKELAHRVRETDIAYVAAVERSRALLLSYEDQALAARDAATAAGLVIKGGYAGDYHRRSEDLQFPADARAIQILAPV